MSTNHHTEIPVGAQATATLFNSRFSDLDSALTTTKTTADSAASEIATARGGAESLDSRLDAIAIGGSNVATLANGVAAAGQKIVTVDSTTGFVVGANVAYVLTGGGIEYNTIASVDSGTQLTLVNNIGTGGIADNNVVSQVPLGVADMAGNYDTPADRLVGIDELPGVIRLAATAVATATALTIRTPPDSNMAGMWVAIAPGTTDCEIRRVNSISGQTVNLNSALANTHAADVATMLLPNGPVHNVALFGANANAADNSAAIQAAFDNAMALGLGTIVINDTYQIESSITAIDAADLEIIGGKNGRLSPTGGSWNSTKAVLNMAGAIRCVVRGLRIDHSLTGSSAPAAGIVIGRGPTQTGGGNTFYDCFIDGEYQSACVYNAAGEVVKFFACNFIQKTANPVYYNSSYDPDSLCTGGTFPESNTRHTFVGCELNNYSNAADQKVIELNGNVSETVIKNCYIGLTARGTVIETSDAAASNIVNRCIFEENRVEGTNDADSLFIYSNNSGGLNHSRVNNIVWTITSDYIVEFASGGTNNVIDLADLGSAAKAVHFSGGQVQYSFIRVTGQLEIGSGVSPVLNIIHAANTTDPLTGAGEGGVSSNTYKANKILSLHASGNTETEYNTDHEWLVMTTAGFADITGKKRVEVDFASAGNLNGFTAGKDGQLVVLYFNNGNCTVAHGTGGNDIRLNGSANFSAATGDTLTIVKNRGNGWSEVSRMVR